MATLITMPGVAAGNDAAQILSWLKKKVKPSTSTTSFWK